MSATPKADLLLDALRDPRLAGNPFAETAKFRVKTADNPDAEAQAVMSDCAVAARRLIDAVWPVVEAYMADGTAAAERHANAP